MQLMRVLLLVGCTLVSWWIAQPVCQAQQDPVQARQGMVVSVSAPASDAGLEVLKQGGNAVDAAVATAFALAVTHPAAGNIGGGGFMMVDPGPKGEVVCIDYRETAPASAHVDMYLKQQSALGHAAVGVPGTVRGLELAHRQFGRLHWRELVMPAVQLAEQGFAIDASLAASLNRIVAQSTEFEELKRVYGKPDGKSSWQAGDKLVQKELAATLRKIAEHGPDAFYRGEIAEQIVDEMKQGDGWITAEDLANYRAVIRKPIHGTYRGYDVYGPPPPSSGGICLIQMLQILEPFELSKRDRWSADTLHLMIEAMRRAYLDRARYLGDPDFVDIPDHLTSKEYARKLAATIRMDAATPSESLADDIPLSTGGDSTTHFSIVDGDGMAVSNTYTLEQSYGSRVVVRGAGFLLNNEMGDFNWKPGVTNRQGKIGTPPNLIAPGKRMLSSMTPTIVRKDGRTVLVTGSPGGRTIINTVLCIVLNTLEFEMDIRQAVDAPRLHHQWLPDQARFEAAHDERFGEVVRQLRDRGHRISPRRQGDAHSIWIHDGVYYGAADRRIHGKASGY